MFLTAQKGFLRQNYRRLRTLIRPPLSLNCFFLLPLLSSRSGAYGGPRLPGHVANPGQQQVGELKSNEREAARAGQLGGREQQEGGEAEQGEEGDHRGLGDPHRRHLHRAENRGWILWSASAPTFCTRSNVWWLQVLCTEVTGTGRSRSKLSMSAIPLLAR